MTAFIDNGDGTITFADGTEKGKTYRKVHPDTFRVIDDEPYQLISDEDMVTYYSMRVDARTRLRHYNSFMAYIECLVAEESITADTGNRLSNMMNRFYEFTQEPN